MQSLHTELILTSISPPNTRTPTHQPGDSSISSALDLIIHGNYLAAFQLSIASLNLHLHTKSPLESCIEWFSALDTALSKLMDLPTTTETDHHISALFSAVSALYIFIQANLTGPTIEVLECPFESFLCCGIPGIPGFQDTLPTDNHRHQHHAEHAHAHTASRPPPHSNADTVNRHTDTSTSLKNVSNGDIPLGIDTTSPGDRWALTQLAENGEDLVGRIQYPQYLLLATKILQAALEKDWLPSTWNWWYFRALAVQQRILAGRSAVLREKLMLLTPRLMDAFVGVMSEEKGKDGCLSSLTPGNDSNHASRSSNCSSASRKIQKTLAVSLLLELAGMETSYGYTKEAQDYVAQAMCMLGVEAELSGALGVRTTHQQDPKAQLVLYVNPTQSTEDDVLHERKGYSQQEEQQEHGGESAVALDTVLMAQSGMDDEVKGLDGETDVLKHPQLLDGHPIDTVDERPALARSNKQRLRVLSPLQQAAVLAQCLCLKKGSAFDSMRPWELAAYTDVILQQPNSEFLIRASAYLLTSRSERQRSRTRERALLTLEGLSGALEHKDLGLPVNRRMACAFAAWFPLKVLLQKELGESFVALGLVGAALPLFERLELWDNLIICYRLLDKRVAAQQLILQRLDATPEDPRLWCALGDLTLDDAHYVKAWKSSGHRSVRAQRSLARNAMRQERYLDAMSHWQHALTLSPLHPEGWFHLGWCCIKTEHYDHALHALTRCVQMDSDDGDAWNNLAAVHLQLENWKEAFAALTEAVKHKRESWQTWENYGTAAVKLKEWQIAARAAGETVALSQGSRVDMSVLSALMDHMEDTFGGGGDDDGNSNDTLDAVHPTTTTTTITAGEDDIDTLDAVNQTTTTTTTTITAGEDDIDTLDAAADVAMVFNSMSLKEATSPTTSNNNNNNNKAFYAAMANLMKRIASTAASDSAFWAQYSRYYTALGEHEAALECLLKRVRGLQGSAWMSTKEAFVEYATACIELVTAYIAHGGARELSQGRMLLRGVLKQAEERYGEEEIYRSMQQLLEEELLVASSSHTQKQ